MKRYLVVVAFVGLGIALLMGVGSVVDQTFVLNEIILNEPGYAG